MTDEEAIEAAFRAMHEAQGTGDADEPLQSGYQKSWEEPDSVRWKQWIETCEEVLSAYLEARGAVLCSATPVATLPWVGVPLHAGLSDNTKGE